MYRSVKALLAALLLSVGCAAVSFDAVAAPTAVLTWQAPTQNTDGTPANLVGYRLYRKCDAGAYAQSGPNLPLAPLSYDDSPNIPPTALTCWWKMTAYDAGAESAYSNEVTKTFAAAPDTTPPSAPGTLTVGSPTQTSLALAWGAATDNVGVVGYHMEQCQGATCTTFVQIGDSTLLTGNAPNLQALTTYRFRVRAYDSAGNNGPYSNISNGTTLAAPLAPPSPPSVTNVTFTLVTTTPTPLSVVQTASYNTNGSSATATATFPNPVKIGNTVVGFIWSWYPSTRFPNAFKSASNDVGTLQGTPSTLERVYIGSVVAAHADKAFTFTLNGANQYVRMWAVEVAGAGGVDKSFMLAPVNYGVAVDAAVVPGIVPAVSGSMILAAAFQGNNTNIPAAGTGFTSAFTTTDAAGDAARVEYKVAPTTASTTATFTQTSSTAHTLSVVVLKP